MRRAGYRGVRDRGVVLLASFAFVLATALAGCGGSTSVVEGDFGPDARKALIQKKLDVRARTSRPSRNPTAAPPKKQPSRP